MMLWQLIGALDSCCLCPGNSDLSMSSERKGKFLSVNKEITAYEDTTSGTIRTSGCTIISNERCPSCAKFRPSLRALYSRWQRKPSQSPSKYSNNRYLTTPQKSKKLSKLQARALSAEREIQLLSEFRRKSKV